MPDYSILIGMGIAIAIVIVWMVLFKKCYVDRDCSCPECGYDDASAEIMAIFDMFFMTKYTCKKCGHVWDMTC